MLKIDILKIRINGILNLFLGLLEEINRCALFWKMNWIKLEG